MSANRKAINSLRDIRPHFTVAEPATKLIVSLLVVLGLLFAGDGRAARSVRHDTPVPILMYHVIAAPPAGVAFPDLFVRPSDFRAQMDWLVRKQFYAVSLLQVKDFLNTGVQL